MPQIKIVAAPPPPEPEPKAWPLSSLVEVTAYVAVLTFLTWLLPYPADAIASIGLFIITMPSMAIYDRFNKALSRDPNSKSIVAVMGLRKSA
jgi:hypothetical protein